jgi:hypothetical protein
MTTVNTTTTGHTPTATALRAILAEVTPGIRPHSGDSYLPDHLVQAARLALAQHDQQDTEAQQHAHNAISYAQWHLAHGRINEATGRILSAARHLKQACTESTTSVRAA